MHTYHEWEVDGKRYKAVIDEHYETRGSYAYDSEEETKTAEDREIEMLARVLGGWVAVGIIEYRKCERAEGEAHCSDCSGWVETDSLWGIVVENSKKAIEEFAANNM